MLKANILLSLLRDNLDLDQWEDSSA